MLNQLSHRIYSVKMLGVDCLDIEEKENRSNSNRKCKETLTVAVEGNIGSGKSTFLNYFRKFDNVDVIPEPVCKWKNVHGYNTLEMMYKDAARWSLAFQSYVQLTMAEVHKKKLEKGVKMMERSIYSARYCFVENLRRSNLMPEVDYAILSEFYSWILDQEDTNIDLIVYLQAQPEVCQSRIKQRNRHEEQGVPIDYLKSLTSLHEDWLIKKKFPLPAPVIVIDVNADISELYPKFDACREEIFSRVLL